ITDAQIKFVELPSSKTIGKSRKWKKPAAQHRVKLGQIGTAAFKKGSRNAVGVKVLPPELQGQLVTLTREQFEAQFKRASQNSKNFKHVKKKTYVGLTPFKVAKVSVREADVPVTDVVP